MQTNHALRKSDRVATDMPPLRAVRLARGLGLREVARRARIDAAHLSRVERGERTLSLDALLRVAGVLGLRELERFLAPYTTTPENARARLYRAQGTREDVHDKSTR